MKHGDLSNRSTLVVAIDSRALVTFKKLTLVRKLLNAKAIELEPNITRQVDLIWKHTEFSVAIVNRWDSGIDSEELKALLDNAHIAYTNIELVDDEEELEQLCEHYFAFYFYSDKTIRVPPKSYPIKELSQLARRG